MSILMGSDEETVEASRVQALDPALIDVAVC